MEDDDDDLYGGGPTTQNGEANTVKNKNSAKYDDDGELDDEPMDISDESDSSTDVDIVTEEQGKEDAGHAPGTQVEATQKDQPRPSSAVKISAPKPAVKTEGPAVKTEVPSTTTPGTQLKSGRDYPLYRTSNIDVNAEAIYEPLGKPVGDIDIDADLAEHEKPWRRPGADMTDYFNYGFDEFTWTTYNLRQKAMREQIAQQKQESSNFEMMIGQGMMPGMGMPVMAGMSAGASSEQAQRTGTPSQPAQASGAAPMPGFTQEQMAYYFQVMLSEGLDPTQMDPANFMVHAQRIYNRDSQQASGGKRRRY